MSTLPKDVAIDTDLVRFRSHWEAEGQRVTATREFVSTLPGPVCDEAARARIAPAMAAIRDDLMNQVGIRLNVPPSPSGGAEEGAKP